MPNHNYRKTGIKIESGQNGLSPCASAVLNQDGRCAGCCVREAQSLADSEKPEWKPVLLTIGNMEFPKGARLYREGEAGAELYSLRSGAGEARPALA